MTLAPATAPPPSPLSPPESPQTQPDTGIDQAMHRVVNELLNPRYDTVDECRDAIKKIGGSIPMELDYREMDWVRLLGIIHCDHPDSSDFDEYSDDKPRDRQDVIEEIDRQIDNKMIDGLDAWNAAVKQAHEENIGRYPHDVIEVVINVDLHTQYEKDVLKFYFCPPDLKRVEHLYYPRGGVVPNRVVLPPDLAQKVCDLLFTPGHELVVQFTPPDSPEEIKKILEGGD